MSEWSLTKGFYDSLQEKLGLYQLSTKSMFTIFNNRNKLCNYV